MYYLIKYGITALYPCVSTIYNVPYAPTYARLLYMHELIISLLINQHYRKNWRFVWNRVGV